MRWVSRVLVVAIVTSAAAAVAVLGPPERNSEAQGPPCQTNSWTGLDVYGSETSCPLALRQSVTARLHYLEQSVPDWFVVATSQGSCSSCFFVSMRGSLTMPNGWYFTQGIHLVLYNGSWWQTYSWSPTYYRP